MEEGFGMWDILGSFLMGMVAGVVMTFIIFAITNEIEPTTKYQPNERIEVIITDNRKGE